MGIFGDAYIHLTPGSIEIFRRRRRRQPEVGLKTSISQQWSTGSLSDWQA